MSAYLQPGGSTILNGAWSKNALDLLLQLEPETQEVFAPLQDFPAGINLYQQDAAAREVYFLERGLVKQIRTESNGQQTITGLYFTGAVLGAEATITHERHPVTATTIINCSLRRVPAATFRHLLESDMQLSRRLHEILSRELFDKVARISQLACSSAEQRLKALLTQLTNVQECRNSPQGLKQQLPLKHWEIAQLIAVTPAYLSRLFDKLEQDDVVRRERGWLIIPDLQKLAEW